MMDYTIRRSPRARRADLPVDEIVRVGNTLVVHEDPAPAAN